MIADQWRHRYLDWNVNYYYVKKQSSYHVEILSTDVKRKTIANPRNARFSANRIKENNLKYTQGGSKIHPLRSATQVFY